MQSPHQQNATVQTATPSQSKLSNFLFTVSCGVSYFINEVEKGITKASEEINKAWSEASDKRFRGIFAPLPDERLIGEFWGQCVSGTKSYSCSCYVSNKSFNFVVDLPNGKSTVVIPLRDIVNVQQGVLLRGSGGAPIIHPVTEQHVQKDTLQIFTADLKVHQFHSFLHYDKAYYALMHVWQPPSAAQPAAPQGGYIPTQTGPTTTTPLPAFTAPTQPPIISAIPTPLYSSQTMPLGSSNSYNNNAPAYASVGGSAYPAPNGAFPFAPQTPPVYFTK